VKPSSCSCRMTWSQLEASAQAPFSSTMVGLGPLAQRNTLLAWAEAAWVVAATREATVRTAVIMIRRSLAGRAAHEVHRFSLPQAGAGHRPGTYEVAAEVR